MRIILLPLLLPAAGLFFLVAWWRSKLYSWGVLKSHSVSCKVVSVGNITSGGTGKTPFVRWLAEKLSRRGNKVCVLSRGYGRSSTGILKVDAQSDDVRAFGDEALLLARGLEAFGVSVYVGVNRVEAARLIVDQERPRVIILDDGFQHRKLKRDLDIVLLDGTDPWWFYLPLPLGYARENRAALRRAQYIVNTKTKPQTNRVEPHQFFMQSQIQISLPPLAPVTLLTTIAKPDYFAQQVKDVGLTVLEHFRFDDHHSLTEFEVQEILLKSKKLGAQRVLMTEKDWVKVMGMCIDQSLFLVVAMNVSISNEGELIEGIGHMLG